MRRKDVRVLVVLFAAVARVVMSESAEGSALLDALLGTARGGALGSATPFISQANLTAAVRAWPGHDVAVFFYSPYGQAGNFSRQVLPLWDEVAAWHARKKTRNLVVAKFSCEASLAHQQLCYDIGVRQYPTITFYGYSRLSLRRGPLRRSTSYRGLALFEALRDWTVAMRFISWLQRAEDRVLQFFGFRPTDEQLELRDLRARLEMESRRALERDRADLDRRLEDALASAEEVLQRASSLNNNNHAPSSASSASSSGGGARAGAAAGTRGLAPSRQRRRDDADAYAYASPDDAGATTWDDILADLARAAAEDATTTATATATEVGAGGDDAASSAQRNERDAPVAA